MNSPLLSEAMAAIPTPHNGRWDKLPPPEKLRPDYAKAMGELVAKQQAVGQRGRPVLVIWGVDVASEEELETFRAQIVHFLERVRPARLMLSGRRALEIAKPAEELLRHALGAVAAEDVGPREMITGGADGVDSVAVRIARDDPTRTVVGQYTPTAFARADVEGKLNPTPVQIIGFQGLQPGASPLRHAEEMALPPTDTFEFLALMEGQWEARDTHNAELADACVAFLSAGKTGHDGTKATLNIFGHGRYAHPPAEGTASPWEVEAGRRSPGVVALSGGGANDANTTFVGYKILNAPSPGLCAAAASALDRVLDVPEDVVRALLPFWEPHRDEDLFPALTAAVITRVFVSANVALARGGKRWYVRHRSL